MARSAADDLRDAIEAIRAIEAYTHGGKDQFVRDPMQRDAVVARLMQIGQAVKDAGTKGLDLQQLSPDIPWRNVAGMRDKLAHRYWLMDVEIVWAVVERELPRLRSALEALVGKA